jgi:glycogen operon protein
LYERTGRPPHCSINFITSHDGFTLNDLVTYKDKHNEANGEGNRDGDNNNLSDNYGLEGPTRRKTISQLRIRQIKNMLATLLLSQGVPMIVSGDESRRTQRGNNNAYCQDNNISWFDWRLVKKNATIVRFVQALTHFRRSQPTVRRRVYLTGQPTGSRQLPDVSWFDCKGNAVDWNGQELTLTCLLTAPGKDEDPEGLGRDILLLFNSTPDPVEFKIPKLVTGRGWRTFIDTGNESPHDVYPDGDGPLLSSSGKVKLTYRSMCCFVAE